jgi:hypothetical protein
MKPFTPQEIVWIESYFRGIDGGPWRSFTNAELFAKLQHHGMVDRATRTAFPKLFYESSLIGGAA